MSQVDEIAQARIRQLEAERDEWKRKFEELDHEFADLHIKLADRDETIAAMYGEAIKARNDRSYEPLEIVPDAG